MKAKRYLIVRDEPGAADEQIIDEADTREELARKLLDWAVEYPFEISGWDTKDWRPIWHVTYRGEQ